MDVLSNAFEKKWFCIFMFLYVIIMVPFPFFFSTTYIPSLWGIPLFVVGWTVHTVITLALILVFAWQALQREEYREFDDR
jgi:hypothetical protein